MRHLAEPFALGALRRGRPIEQFLGPAGSPERPGVRYVEISPVKTGYEIYLHSVEDGGDESFWDLGEFLPLDPDDERAEFGLLITTADDPLTALNAAERHTGAVRGRWVNEAVSQDEYRDFVLAGRPATASPDGHPGPHPRPACPPTPSAPPASTSSLSASSTPRRWPRCCPTRRCTCSSVALPTVPSAARAVRAARRGFPRPRCLLVQLGARAA